MSIDNPTDDSVDVYERATKNLSAFVVDQAKKMAAKNGFGWVPRPDAPDTHPLLVRAHQVSRMTGQPLPVSSLFCDTVMFTHPSINHAFRYWHDSLHIDTGLTFMLPDELELSLHHLALSERGGLHKHSLEYALLRIDMVGQNYLLGVAKRFAIDQGQFVRDCLRYGIDEGVLREARRDAS